MRAKTILFIAFMASLLVAAVVVMRGADNVQAAEPAMALAAAEAVPAGTLLRPQDLKWQAVPDSHAAGLLLRPTAAEQAAKPNADELALEKIYGAVTRQDIKAGEPVLASALVQPGDRSFLETVLGAGYRAISVPVTTVAGAAGRIFPGDHVDVILTQTFTNGQGSAAHRSVSETVVQNLRVLAIDQRTQDGNASDATAHSVTLEVLPKQAEMVSVANELGKLSLTLRSADAISVATADGTPHSTWADEVSPALRDAKVPTVEGGIKIMRGSQTETTSRN